MQILKIWDRLISTTSYAAIIVEIPFTNLMPQSGFELVWQISGSASSLPQATMKSVHLGLLFRNCSVIVTLLAKFIPLPLSSMSGLSLQSVKREGQRESKSKKSIPTAFQWNTYNQTCAIIKSLHVTNKLSYIQSANLQVNTIRNKQCKYICK